MKREKHIGIDLDEVLVPLLPRLKKYYVNKYKKTPRGTVKYDFSEIFNMNKIESAKFVEEYYNSIDAYLNEPYKNSKNFLIWLKNNEYKISLITDRQYYARKYTKIWCDFHFEDLYDKIYYTNKQSHTGGEINKTVLCDVLNIDTIIDDNENELDISNHKTNILYGDYVWQNKNIMNVEYAKDYEDVKKILIG